MGNAAIFIVGLFVTGLVGLYLWLSIVAMRNEENGIEEGDSPL